MTENNEVWIESDAYINAETKLESLMGVEKYEQFCKDYDKKKKEQKFLEQLPFLEIDNIIENKFRHFETCDGDVSNFSYFGVWVRQNKFRYDLTIDTKRYNGQFLNPYYSQKYEKLTIEAAQELINKEAKRMFNVGTYYVPYSVLIEELNKY
jgi:hypothetical protein